MEWGSLYGIVTGSGGAIVVAALWLYHERKERVTLSDKVMELAKASIAANLQSTHALDLLRSKLEGKGSP